MKKFLFLFWLMILAWCWTQEQAIDETAVEETPEQQKTIIDFDMWTDEAIIGSSNWVEILPIYMQEVSYLTSTNMFLDDLDAGQFAKYMIVWYLVMNNSNNEIIISSDDAPKIYDSNWRWYSSDSNASQSVYIKQAMWFWTTLRPWIPVWLAVSYLVAKDSTWFYLSYEWTWTETRIHLRDNSKEVHQ